MSDPSQTADSGAVICKRCGRPCDLSDTEFGGCIDGYHANCEPPPNADRVGPLLLAVWLIEHGYAEEKRGYGHVSGEDLAEALLAAFVITLPSNERSGA